MKHELRTRELINRLARLDAAEAWEGDLNPTQRAVLDYLSRANRFSKSPSQVAEYLGSTRGTISQTLKSLGQKGYVTERRSVKDRRAISFDLTKKGLEVTRKLGEITASIAELSDVEHTALQETLTILLKNVLLQNEGRLFDQCKNCDYFLAKDKGGFCNLLSEELSESEIFKICHEQVSA